MNNSLANKTITFLHLCYYWINKIISMTEREKFKGTLPIFVYSLIAGLLLTIVPIIQAYDQFSDNNKSILFAEIGLLYAIVVVSMNLSFTLNLRWRKYLVAQKVKYNFGLFGFLMLLGLMIHGPIWKMAFPFDENEAFLHSSFPTSFFFRDTAIRNIIIICCSYYGAELYLSVRENFNMRMDMAELKTENINSQLTTLTNQLNPHFLFNALNTLSGLVQENPEKSEEFIFRLSQVLRFSLTMQENKLVTLKEEIEFARAFAFLLKVRFEEKISFNFEFDKNLENKKVPPLCTQLLLENVTKHNQMSNKMPIDIRLHIEDNHLYVCNNLNPNKNKESSGYGLKNLNRRCELLIGKSIKIMEQNNRFIICVPYLEIQNVDNQ